MAGTLLVMSYYSDVEQKYSSFWLRFYASCSKGGLVISPKTLSLHVETLDSTKIRVSLKEPIFLKDWPQRPGSGKFPLQIVINSCEEVSFPKLKILNSTVGVDYYELGRNGDNVSMNLLESLHYDYKDPADAGHPLFHAQLSNRPINEGVLLRSELSKRYSIRLGSLSGRLKNIRIPTAHMGLASVLVGLMADHSPSNLGDIIAAVNAAKLPKPYCRRLNQKIVSDACSFSSLHWYALT